MVDGLVVHEAPTLPGLPHHYVWLSFLVWVDKTGAPIGAPTKECCGCHRNVAVTDVWSVMAVDANNLICSVGYLFCSPCRFGEDPAHAWRHADADWNARRKRPTPKPDILLERPVGL